MITHGNMIVKDGKVFGDALQRLREFCLKDAMNHPDYEKFKETIDVIDSYNILANETYVAWRAEAK